MSKTIKFKFINVLKAQYAMLIQRRDEAVLKLDYPEAQRLKDESEKIKYKMNIELIRQGTIIINKIMGNHG